MVRVVTVRPVERKLECQCEGERKREPDIAILESELGSYNYESTELTVDCGSMEEAYRTIIAYNDAREEEGYNFLGHALSKARKAMKIPVPIFSTPPVDEPLKLYMLRQSEFTREDAYNCCIVLARNEEEARNTHPLGSQAWTNRIPSWISAKKKHLIDVMELGVSTIKDMGPGTVLSKTVVGDDDRHLSREVRYYEYWKKEQDEEVVATV
jgi:hypothetical protein